MLNGRLFKHDAFSTVVETQFEICRYVMPQYLGQRRRREEVWEAMELDITMRVNGLRVREPNEVTLRVPGIPDKFPLLASRGGFVEIVQVGFPRRDEGAKLSEVREVRLLP
jgi:hypothetical protein